ncbi:uncharacterized protein LOC111270775 [Varroa jacobsoni]|uniref:uncharacterized protein LOC111270775 n=1 Tax=Varroa jacobsoni TaxID=62625 RepID=UPI000BF4D9B0|nr:uncharacterized protein LOC111270775 [Varroa jacobsoni]
MLNLSASCTAKGAFCERSTDPCMQKQNQALECSGQYGSPCQNDADCIQADIGLTACVQGFCNCTALYRVSTRGVCVRDVTLPGGMALLSGSVFVLLVCVVALLLTGIFALYSYDYRLEMNLQKLDLIKEISRRGKDSNRPSLADLKSTSPSSPHRKAASYAITDRPNWKRFRDHFIAHDDSPRNNEKLKLDRPESKPVGKAVNKETESHDGFTHTALGTLIRNVVQENSEFFSEVGANVADSLAIKGNRRKTIANMVEKMLEVESQFFALESGDWTLL